MMIADEQQQDDKPHGALVLGEDFQPTPEVNVHFSEEFLATHITAEKKPLFLVPVGVQDHTVWSTIDTAASRHLMTQRDNEALTKPPTVRPP